MTVLKKGMSARWWFSLAVFAALVCVGLAASNTLAAVPTGKPAAGQPAAGQPSSSKGDKVAPSVPLICTNDYVITSSTGASIVPGTTDIGNHTDDGTTAIVLPFSYVFYGNTFTGANVSSNGNIQFTSANGTFSNVCPLPASTMNNAIYALWDDQCTANCDGGITLCTGCGIFTSVSGVSPNRILNIEFRTNFYGQNTLLNYEVRLYESAGINGGSQFDVIYGSAISTTSASIGVQEGTGTHSTTYSCNTGSVASGLLVHYEQNCTGPTFTPTNTPTVTPTPTLTNTPTATGTPVPCGPGSNYIISSSTSTIISGTVDIGNHTDDGVTLIGLPFPFNFYGTPFNSANVSSNGTLQFTSANTGFSNACLPQTPFNDTIFPFWDDQRTDQVGTGCSAFPAPGCGVFTATQGVSPNRTFIIEWRSVYFSPSTTSLNYEVLLHEGPDGAFDVVYGTMNGTGISATVGVQRGTGSQFTQYECNTGGISDTLDLTFSPFGCGSPTLTPTNSATRTNTPTVTNTPTPILTATPTPTLSCTPTGYNFTTSTGATLTPGVNDIGNHTDDGTTAITLPFAFNFYGTPFTTANVGANGTLQFTSNATAYSNICLPTTTFTDAILPHWDDLMTDTETNCSAYPGSLCGIFTDTQGTAPNRTFIIEWRAVYYLDGPVINFEVLLHEGAAGSFDVVYGTVTNSGVSATVGSQKDTGSLYTQVECNTGGLTAGEKITFTYVVGNCPTNTPTYTPSITPTGTNTATATIGSPTSTRTNTPTPTLSNTPTQSPTPSPTVCAASSIFTEVFEGGLGQFSSQVPTCVPGGCGWVITSTSHSGVGAAFAPNGSNISDQILVSTNPIAIPAFATQAELSFWHQYAFENPTTAYDGGVVEVSTDGGTTWITNTTFLQSGYNATLSTCCSNPLAGRPAFANSSAGFINSRVNLAAYAGQNILVRFREGTDSSIAATGWYIDDVTVVVDGPCTPTPTPTPAGQLVVHVTWQGIPQPSSRNTTETITMTLRSTGGGPATEYTGYTTDANGNFTVSVSGLPNGTYNMRVKGPRNLSSGVGVCTDTVTLTGAPITTHESGLMRAGDAQSIGSTNFNVVNSSDFTTLKNTFGKSYGQVGYDARADFNNTDNVDASDFSLLKGNFGQAGCGPALDPGGGSKSEDSGSPPKTDRPIDAPPGGSTK